MALKEIGPLTGAFMYRLVTTSEPVPSCSDDPIGAALALLDPSSRKTTTTLEPVTIACSRDETGKVIAWIADLANDRKGRTTPGALWEEADLSANVYLTFGQVARAARKAATAVIIGRRNDVRGRFAVELARLTPTNVAGIVLADWRVEQHDAKKAGFTLNQIMRALREAYNQ